MESNKSTELTTLTPLTEKIVELKVEGKSNKQIAEIIGVPVSTVRNTLSKPDVKKWMNDVITTTANAIVSKHVNTIGKIIESKLKKLQDEGKDLSDASKKDIVDLIQILNSMAVNQQKLEKDDGGNTYIQILNNILE